MYELYSMGFGYMFYNRKLPEEQSASIAYAICRLVGHTANEAEEMLYKMQGDDVFALNKEILETVNNVIREGRKYYDANKTKTVLIVDLLKKIIRFHEQSMQQQQQTHAPVDETPADDLDNEFRMQM